MSDASSAASRWLVHPRPDATAMVRLFCFSYAGAGTTVYHGWANAMPPGVEVVLVRLPGRETRIKEPPLTSMTAIVEALVPVLKSELDCPFAFFGHSMGGLVAFEVARELRRQGGGQPLELLISGRHAPHIQHLDTPIHALPQPAFVDELIKRYNGIQRSILEVPELLKVYLPCLRGDFAVLETYAYVAEPPLDCPIATFGGHDDSRALPEELDAWKAHTSAGFSRQMFPGGHFYLNDKGGSREGLLSSLSQHLVQLLVP
ncbi:alpha/beta fold hydrolase [Stigmatella sp. ncwal1]|uniref:Alpha/beta fold hydrolase n=1 Tax=Stigmatella ashevillensis TaxID=2995309 RepID=A0ABT5D8F8_9BACT|nr:alpha/beta fold hydrolase [Stigmatella ashevillena]MDC0708556.1 alpha/beta fold hydrolase [Stigmatella ashevillena]